MSNNTFLTKVGIDKGVIKNILQKYCELSFNIIHLENNILLTVKAWCKYNLKIENVFIYIFFTNLSKLKTDSFTWYVMKLKLYFL